MNCESKAAYDSFSKELSKSLNTGFISRTVSSNSNYGPRLLINNYHEQKKILTAITNELQTCQEFMFSVAFITSDGLAALLQVLDELARLNIKGRILTTNYLTFTDPKALIKLLEFPNLEVRVYTCGGFHPKGYIFRQTNYYSMIIGSANLTQNALTSNQEWSVQFLSCFDGQIIFTVTEEFERIWNKSELVTKNWVANYSAEYTSQNEYRFKISKELALELRFETSIDKGSELESDEEIEVVPNKMQTEAMAALQNLRNKGETRALLIAATGTGKTYLSIFDVLQAKAKKVLYIAHRDMILTKSEKSFKAILGSIHSGFLTGAKKDFDADYLFASIFTLVKDDVLRKFNSQSFDYIIVDEVHHAGAPSYVKVINYFKPKFLLGLTATPERTDGLDIFSLFNNNIAYEIRLQKALEENLLCPFHYYGLSDLTINGEVINDKTEFKKLISDERIVHIKKALKLYRNNSCPIKGLIFCSRIPEGQELSKKLNAEGFYTKFLSGADSDEQREAVIEQLESDEDPLEYIIAVDIFNEGVDIPSVNQIVMLRPTQSAIIFVQQLGRGLRKNKSKPYVSVIDFIGNYENNFFIPIALYGDNSYNKDNLRRVLVSGSSSLPGASTIQINQTAKQKIFEAIAAASFKKLPLLRDEYTKVKQRLGRVPCMMDFVTQGGIDPLLFIQYASSYYLFKCKIELDYPQLTSFERASLQFISLEFCQGIRIHELLILKLLITHKSLAISELKIKIQSYAVPFTQDDIIGACTVLSPDFYTQNDKKKYHAITYAAYNQQENTLQRSDEFSALLQNELYKSELLDCIDYGLHKCQLKDGESYEKNNLVLYRKYTRKDVCKLLNWQSDCSSTIYGYKTERSTIPFTCPIFVTYHKKEDVTESLNYDDTFIDESLFSWMTRNNRTAQSEEVAAILNQKENNIRVLLFVKKNDNEGTDFYYLGDMTVHSFEETEIKTSSGNRPVVSIKFDMKYPVRQDMYEYLETC